MPKGIYKRKSFTQEHRNNIGKAQEGRKYLPQQGFQKGQIPWNKNKKGVMPIPWNKNLTKETDERIRKYGEKGGKTKKGTKYTEEHKDNIGKGNIGKHSGKKCTFYIDGRMKENNLYPEDWTKTLRRSIRQRDKYTCFICKKNGFSVHHIDYDKDNLDPNNLITLCRKCHAKTNYNRKYWINYFKNI